MTLPYIAAGLLGALVGIAELVSRYKDNPLSIFGVPSAWLYILLNAAGSVGALNLAQTFNWTLGAQDAASVTTMQVLACGAGSMVVLRSSFLNLKLEGKVVPIGPSVILMSLLSAADRGVDRVRARSRSETSKRIMEEISFEKAKVCLPAYCLGLMQNASAQEQEDLRTAVNALASSGDLTDTQKSLTLGLLLLNLVGAAALESAVNALANEIKVSVVSAVREGVNAASLEKSPIGASESRVVSE